jgi:hypothetical protein
MFSTQSKYHRCSVPLTVRLEIIFYSRSEGSMSTVDKLKFYLMSHPSFYVMKYCFSHV